MGLQMDHGFQDSECSSYGSNDPFFLLLPPRLLSSHITHLPVPPLLNIFGVCVGGSLFNLVFLRNSICRGAKLAVSKLGVNENEQSFLSKQA